MGDMADLLMDQSMDDFDECGAPQSKTCRYCGTTNLHWRELVCGWRLFDGNEMHVCPIDRKSKGDKKVTKFKTFWILWQPGSSYPPKVRFDTKKAAQEAAEVMTHRHKAEFYVMRAEALCQIATTPIKWSGAKEK